MGTVDSADWRTSTYSDTNGECVEIATWRKSTRSGTNGGCVEVGDTKDRTTATLTFTRSDWQAFTASLATPAI